MSDQFADIVFTLAATAADDTAADDFDSAASLAVLRAYGDFIDAEVAPTNAPGDRAGCRLENGRVRLPADLPALYCRYVDLGWHLLPLSTAVGGIGAPAPVVAAGTELLCGANHAFQMLVSLVPGAVLVIERFGTAEQRAALLPDFATGVALVTMCLSEPDAGSDLGAIRTSARQAETGWQVTGEKIFVSGGDQDMSPRIVHLVLARTGTIAEGVRGLSLFACPSHLPDGTPNAIRLLRIEEKLGLHASPTCQLRFEGARAQLLGQPGDGLRAMFVMMDHARLDVAVQGVAHAAQAHRRAADYAGQRQQGGRTIAQHGDVARMLMEMELLTLGTRAMAYRATSVIDDADLAAFLTPVCKVYCTETASRVADLGIQVLGGYGYLTELGMEQIWRDARVTRIYEGTNGVLAMTLVRRLLGGAPQAAFLREIEAASCLTPGEDLLDALRAEWTEAVASVRAAPEPGFVAACLMELTGLLFFAACWIRLEAAGGDAARAGRLAQLGQYLRISLLPNATALRIRCQGLAQMKQQDQA